MVISTLLFLHKSMAPQLLKKLKTCNSLSHDLLLFQIF